MRQVPATGRLARLPCCRIAATLFPVPAFGERYWRMPTFRKPLLTGLLIVVLLCVTSAGAHAATHASGFIANSCDFCVGHGDPVAAAPAVGTLPFPARADTGTPVYRCRTVRGSPVVNRRQRAPPLLS